MDSDDFPRKVELGCGIKKPEGFLGVDARETEKVDLVQDLDDPAWSLPSNHFSVIRAIDLFEHLENPVVFMEEIYRIARSDATIIIRCPHISSDNWHDPTHRRLAGSRTFEHFTEQSRFPFYSEATFEINEIEITFEWTEITLVRKLGYFIANRSPWLFERSFLKNLFPATNICFNLTPIK